MSPLLITLGLLVTGNIIAIHMYQKSRRPVPVNHGGPTTAALIYDGARPLALNTRRFVRHAFDNLTPRFLVVALIASAIGIWSAAAEFGFLRLTFMNLFGETPDGPAQFFGIPLSVVFAGLIVALAVLAGLVLFDGLGTTDPEPVITTPEEPATIEHRPRRGFYLRLAATNVLIVMALIQLILGYFRSDELLMAAQLRAQVAGSQPPAVENYSMSLRIVTAVLAFLAPLVSAATARYVLILATWLVASILAVVLSIGLWLPTWVLSRVVIRQQGTGVEAPPLETEPISAGANQPPDDAVTNNQPNTHAPDQDPAADRAQETEDRLRDLEEAEVRRRERANAYPFNF